jgi:hypothetical protein
MTCCTSGCTPVIVSDHIECRKKRPGVFGDDAALVDRQALVIEDGDIDPVKAGAISGTPDHV